MNDHLLSDRRVFLSLKDPEFSRRLANLKRPLVFTNGCFDLLHRGHVSYLETAASMGESLVVGVNSDHSAQRLGKGDDRPYNTLEDRMAVLASLRAVDAVTGFEEDTPLELILTLEPDVLVKGGDWKIPDIVGAQEVTRWGGQVASIPFEFDLSTTRLVDLIQGGKTRSS